MLAPGRRPVSRSAAGREHPVRGRLSRGAGREGVLDLDRQARSRGVGRTVATQRSAGELTTPASRVAAQQTGQQVRVPDSLRIQRPEQVIGVPGRLPGALGPRRGMPQPGCMGTCRPGRTRSRQARNDRGSRTSRPRAAATGSHSRRSTSSLGDESGLRTHGGGPRRPVVHDLRPAIPLVTRRQEAPAEDHCHPRLLGRPHGRPSPAHARPAGISPSAGSSRRSGGRCTRATSRSRPRTPSLGRHSTQPAAWITPSAATSSIGVRVRRDRPPAPGLYQVLLQVAEGLPVRIQVVPGPRPIAGQPPRRRALVHGQVDQRTQLRLLIRVSHRDQQLDAPVQVAVHQVGAADPDSPSPPAPSRATPAPNE